MRDKAPWCKLQEHSRSLAELLQQPVDSQALHQLEKLSYQLEGDLLALGSAWARVLRPWSRCINLEAMHNWQSGSLS
ncbi:hypothetical protein UMZ34_21925 [Halopseudomonas pachastrellae]|nr:hypothetical protein UMZ34_21925 [Halopseudomonas pachastrellae]